MAEPAGCDMLDSGGCYEEALLLLGVGAAIIDYIMRLLAGAVAVEGVV